MDSNLKRVRNMVIVLAIIFLLSMIDIRNLVLLVVGSVTVISVVPMVLYVILSG